MLFQEASGPPGGSHIWSELRGSVQPPGGGGQLNPLVPLSEPGQETESNPVHGQTIVTTPR